MACEKAWSALRLERQGARIRCQAGQASETAPVCTHRVSTCLGFLFFKPGKADTTASRYRLGLACCARSESALLCVCTGRVRERRIEKSNRKAYVNHGASQ